MRKLDIVSVIAVLTLLMTPCSAARSAKPRNAAAGNAVPKPVVRYSPSERVYDVSFAARSTLLATRGCPVGPDDWRLQVWNTQTWALCCSIDIDDQEISNSCNSRSIALSPDGRLLACITGSEVLLWNTATAKLEKRLNCPAGAALGIAWSPNGRRIAAGATGGANVYDVSSGKVVRSFARGDVAFSADGQTLGIAGLSTAASFDVDSGRKIVSYTDKAGVHAPIALSSDGRYVATAGVDPTLLDPDPPADEEGHPYASSEPMYHQLIGVKVWDRRTGKLVALIPGHNNSDGGTHVLQFTPDSRKLFSGGDFSATLWDIGSRRIVRWFENTLGSAMSPDGKMIAVGLVSEECGLRVYDVKTGRLLMKTSSKVRREGSP